MGLRDFMLDHRKDLSDLGNIQTSFISPIQSHQNGFYPQSSQRHPNGLFLVQINNLDKLEYYHSFNTNMGIPRVKGLNSIEEGIQNVHATRASQLAAQQLALMAEQDLVVASPSDRNWKGIIIAVLVIVSVLALIVTSVVLLTPPDLGPRVKGRRFELDDVFGTQFQPIRINGSWISESEWVFGDDSGGISILDVKTLKIRSIVNNFTMSRYTPGSFTISANQKFALLAHDIKQIHRHSFTAKYTVVDIPNGDPKPLTLGQRHSKDEKFEFDLVKWSPVGNSLILVHEGDIYYKEKPNDTTFHRITDTSETGVIYNGIPDWLYEEEVLASNTALWFSPDGQKLLYLTFNDSMVGEHHMLQYGTPESPFQYPQVRTLRYPKPGTNNPLVTATVTELKGGNRSWKKVLEPPEGISSVEYYIVGANWIRNSDIGIIWTARSYNISIISTCIVSTGICEEEYRILREKKGWVDKMQLPIFSKKLTTSKNFIGIVPIRDGDNGFFDHLIYVDTTYRRSHPITHGNFDVIKVHAWDETKKFTYYTATSSDKPNERKLYRVKVDLPYTEHYPECLTCSPHYQTGNFGDTNHHQQHHHHNQVLLERSKDATWTLRSHHNREIPDMSLIPRPIYSKDHILLRTNKSSCSFLTNLIFSPTNDHFVMECGGPEIPYVALYTPPSSATTDGGITSTIRLIKVLQNNDALLNASRQMAFPQIRIFPVVLSSGKSVHVRLLLPPGLREDEITQYPLIVNVDGGPGTQLATNQWEIDFPTFLATKKDYIVAQIDGRGSGGRGWDYQHEVYYNLGHLEADDQIEVTKHLRDSLPYVETNKVGIFGWGYGAYLTALIMTNKDKHHLFQCGASIAPVSKWEFYDSAYAERYMGTPNVTDNFKGYVNSDITRNVENIDKKMFYLLHGTNVHIQHSMLLAKALVNKKIMFRQQIYPDEEHNLSGVKLHVHRSLEDFFEDCYKKQKTPEVETGLNKGGKFDDFD